LKKRLLIAFLATAVIGGLFFWFVDLNQVVELLRLADWRYLAASVIALVVAYILLAIRWRYLLGNRPGFIPSFHSVNVSNLVNSLTPIPEVALRVLITGQGSGMSVPGATSGMLVERSLEQVMRVLAFLIALLTGYVVVINSSSILVNAGYILKRYASPSLPSNIYFSLAPPMYGWGRARRLLRSSVTPANVIFRPRSIPNSTKSNSNLEVPAGQQAHHL